MADELSVTELIKSMQVMVWYFEGEALGCWVPVSLAPMSMNGYLALIGKKAGDLDEEIVRGNLDVVWVARKDTKELPLPLEKHEILSNESKVMHDVVGYKFW